MATLLKVNGLEKTSAEFRRELVAVSERLGFDPNHLASVMSLETGGTFDPSIQNPYTNATGLIQWMPSTARAYGTTVEKLARMSDVEQLAYVEQYFSGYRGRKLDVGDLYLAVFYPAAIGKPDSWVIGRKGDDSQLYGISRDKLYTQNRGFDSAGKGYYDVGDIKRKVRGIYARAVTAGPLGAPTLPSLDPKDLGSGDSSSPSASPLPTLRIGSHGPAVELWQRLLNSDPNRGLTLTIDGDFGPVTRATTRHWQSRRGLNVDGVVGPVCWRRMP